MPDCPHILSAILSERWAIQPEALDTILAIAQRLNESPDAVAAKLGRPLRNAPDVRLRDGVAVVPVTGPIFRYANVLTEVSGATSIEVLAKQFTAAVDDPAVHAVVLEIDSPGGQVAGVSEFAELVRTASKPTAAYISDLGASAAYWIAAAADQVVIRDTAKAGSIGVVMRALADTDGGYKFVSSQSPLKHAGPASDEGRAAYQAEVDKLASIFIDSVAADRGKSPEQVMTGFGRGGVLVGADAVAAGMADSLGSLEGLIAKLSKQRGKKMAKPTAEITGELIAAEYPEIAQAFRQEGHAMGFDAGKAEGFKAGAEAERERIRAVESQLLTGHEALIAELKFDGATTGPEAAVKVLQAEKALSVSRQAKRQADMPAPLPFAADEDEPSVGEHGKESDMAELAKQALMQFRAHEGIN